MQVDIKHKNPYYRALINSTRWRKLRNAYLTEHPLCERCLKNGRTEVAKEVHHIDPIESHCEDRMEMTRLAYDPNNIMAVCSRCHGELHKELSTRSKDAITARCKDKAERFKKKYLR